MSILTNLGRSASSLALVATLGCGGSNAAPTGPVASTAVEQALEAAAPRSLLSRLDVARLLPADTRVLIAADGLGSWAERLDWTAIQALVPELGKELGQLRESPATRALADVLANPSRLGALGLDPNAPVGVAVLDVIGDTFAFFARISDRAVLLEQLGALAQDRSVTPVREAVGEATLITLPGESHVALLLLEDQLLVVAAGGPSREAAAGSVARALLRSGEETLAASPSFIGAIAKSSGQALGAYVDLQGLIDDGLAAETHHCRLEDQGSDTYCAKKLATADKLGALAKRYLGPTAAIVAGADVTGRSLSGSLRLHTGDGAKLTTLLRQGSGTPALVSALDRTPLFALSSTFDPTAALGLVGEVADVAGESMDGVEAFVMKTFGVGLAGDILKVLDGEVGFAFTVMEPARLEHRPTGVVFTLGLTDVAGAQRLMARAADFPGLSSLLERQGELLVVRGSTPVYAGIAGSTFAVTTDRSALTRLAGDDSRSFGDLVQPDVRPLVTGLTAATALGVLDFGEMAQLFMGFSRIVWNTETVAMRGERAALDQQIADTQRASSELEAARVTAGFAAAGSLVGRATVDATGVHVTGGWFTGKDSFRGALHAIVAATRRSPQERALDDVLSTLRRQRDALPLDVPEPALE